MTSAPSTLVDSPATEAFPRWLTLGEATFITRVDEEVLQSWVASGKLRCDRSLSRRLGQHYLLVLREDLEAGGLLEAPMEPPPALDRPLVETGPTFVASTPPSMPPAAPLETGERGAAPVDAAPLARVPAPRSLSLPRLTPRTRTATRWAVLGTLVGLLVAASFPVAFRYRSFAVTSNRMEPFLHRGDLMLARPVQASRLRLGDVVALVDRTNGQIGPTRVRVLGRSAGLLHIETATDRAHSVAHWTLPLDAKVPVVSHRITFIGAIVSRLPHAARTFVPFGLPVLVLLALVTFGILTRRRVPPPVPAT